MPAKAKVNWLAVRTAYVVKGWSAQRCAEEFNVHHVTVKNRASKEGWTAERTRNTTRGSEVVAEVMRQAVDEQIEQNAEAAAETIAHQMDTLALGARLGNKLAIAAERLLDKYINEDEVDGEGKFVAGIQPGEKQSEADVLNAIADAVRKAVTVGRDIGGLEKGKPSVVTGKDVNAPRRFTFAVAPKPVEEPISESVAS